MDISVCKKSSAECKQGAILSFVFLLCALPWLFFPLRYAIHGDVAFLSMAAEQVLAGQRMVDAYFDNNPPLSYLLYIPVVLLTKLGIPLWYSAYIYIFSILCVSLAMTAKFLRDWLKFDRAVYWGLLTCYFVTQTVLTGYIFGVKDTLMGLTLAPFLLAQLLLTFRGSLSWSGRAAILIGALFILAKPQYGLLAAALLIHRAVREKRWTVVFDFDSLALAAGAIIYALVVVLWFPDFLQVGMKSIVALYTSHIGAGFLYRAMGPGILACLALFFAWAAERTHPLRPVALFWGGMTVLAWVCFAIQGKVPSAHLLPLTALMLPVIFLTVSLHIPAYQKNSYRLSLITIAGIFLVSYFMVPPDPGYMTHNEMKKTFWARYVREHAGKPGDSFYITAAHGVDIFHPLAVYTGVPVASRFSWTWFLVGMTNMSKEGGHTEELKHWRGVFAGYMAEDLSRHKPAFIAIAQELPPQLDWFKAFKKEPVFRKEWSRYRKKEELHVSYKDVLGRPGETYSEDYDVYYRIK